MEYNVEWFLSKWAGNIIGPLTEQLMKEDLEKMVKFQIDVAIDRYDDYGGCCG